PRPRRPARGRRSAPRTCPRAAPASACLSTATSSRGCRAVGPCGRAGRRCPRGRAWPPPGAWPRRRRRAPAPGRRRRRSRATGRRTPGGGPPSCRRRRPWAWAAPARGVGLRSRTGASNGDTTRRASPRQVGALDATGVEPGQHLLRRLARDRVPPPGVDLAQGDEHERPVVQAWVRNGGDGVVEVRVAVGEEVEVYGARPPALLPHPP